MSLSDCNRTPDLCHCRIVTGHHCRVREHKSKAKAKLVENSVCVTVVDFVCRLCCGAESEWRHRLYRVLHKAQLLDTKYLTLILLLCSFCIVRLVTVSMAENNLNCFSGSSSPGTSSGSCTSSNRKLSTVSWLSGHPVHECHIGWIWNKFAMWSLQ